MTTYTVFGQAGWSGVNSGTTGARTIGMQFSLSQSATLQAAWFFSNTGLAHLPTGIVLWNLDTGLAVETQLSASWSGAAGSGWVRAPFAGTTTLSASVNYAVSFTDAGSSNVPYYSDLNTDSRFVTGGITSGIITVPDTSHSVHGQAPFSTTVDSLPNTSSSGINFWIDVEVSTSGGTAHTATVTATITPARTVTDHADHVATVHPVVTPARTVTRLAAHVATVARPVAPARVVATESDHVATVHLTVTPARIVIASGGAAHPRPAAGGGSSMLKRFTLWADL